TPPCLGLLRPAGRHDAADVFHHAAPAPPAMGTGGGRVERTEAASALNQTDSAGQRSSLAEMASAELGRREGFGVGFVSRRKALIAACRSMIERNTPRRMRCRVILEKKFSTALSQEAEVGVKWKVQRGWRTSQASTLGCLWVA